MLNLLSSQSIVVKYLSEHIFSYISLSQSYLTLISKVPNPLSLCMPTYTMISFLDLKVRNWHEEHFGNLRMRCSLISCKDFLQIKLSGVPLHQSRKIIFSYKYFRWIRLNISLRYKMIPSYHIKSMWWFPA